MFHRSHTVAQDDPDVWAAIAAENRRQEDHIELIASENYASPAVLAAQGSQLTNKYAEGYPGKRYYGGCEHVDVVEQIAIDRAKKLFHADFANVQPHSGAQANQAVFFAALKPGDTILGMSLPHGGHLTHGSPVNFSGKWFNVVAYGLHPETELIDYDAAERLAHQHKPKLIIAGASAYSRVIDWKRFRAIADSVGARLMVDMAHYAGLIAAGVYPSPVGIADYRDQHDAQDAARAARRPHSRQRRAGEGRQRRRLPGLAGRAADARDRGEGRRVRRGARQGLPALSAAGARQRARARRRCCRSAGCASCPAAPTATCSWSTSARRRSPARMPRRRCRRPHITCNKNAIPNDPEKPFVTSGIRLGSPAITTRGFTELESEELAHLIADVLEAPGDETALAHVRASVRALTHKFPVYG